MTQPAEVPSVPGIIGRSVECENEHSTVRKVYMMRIATVCASVRSHLHGLGGIRTIARLSFTNQPR